MSKAENASLAMARAMYGKRLRHSEFEHMLSLKSVNEIAAYLKNYTSYGDAFEGITSGDFTVKSLEHVIEKSIFNKVAKLCKLEYIIGQSFYKYYVTKIEIEQILNCTRCILTGQKYEYMLSFCSGIERELTIDLYALGTAESLEDMSRVLNDTKYGEVFDRCLNDSQKNYLTFESAFGTCFSHHGRKFADSAYRGKYRQAIVDCISHHNDVVFIEKLTRVITHYNDSSLIRTIVHPDELTAFNSKETEKLLKCRSLEELDAALYKTAYRSIASLSKHNDIKTFLNRYLSSYYKKQIRFSSYPGVIMYCYMCQTRIEGADIIKIIEGNRYGINPDRIRQCICTAEFIKERQED